MNMKYSVLLIILASTMTFGQVLRTLHDEGMLNENSGHLVIGNTGDHLMATGSENFGLQNLVDKALGWVKIMLTAAEEDCSPEALDIPNAACSLEDLLDFAIDPPARAFAGFCLMKFRVDGQRLLNILVTLIAGANREWAVFRKNRLKNFNTRAGERHFQGKGSPYSPKITSEFNSLVDIESDQKEVSGHCRTTFMLLLQQINEVTFAFHSTVELFREPQLGRIPLSFS